MGASNYPQWMHMHGDDVLIDVVVAPRASRTRILDVYDNRLKIQLAAPPVDGKANEALVKFLADTLGCAKAQVEIVGGAANRKKTVRLASVSPQLVFVKLMPVRQP